MSLTRALAEIAIRTEAHTIPAGAVAACKKLVLDTIGVGIAGWNAPGIAGLVDQVQEWAGRQESTVLVHGARVPAANAAFVNSAMVHALDYDDIHDPSALHIMSVVMPTVFAIAESTNATGRQVLESIVLGVETACRIGIPYNRSRRGVSGRGFLPTSVIGGFGATAAACRLLGYDVDRTVNALGLNYAQASGNRQALFEKTLAKRLQPAFTARNAVWSAQLAGRDVTGPEHVFEGEAGLFRVYINAEPPSVSDVMRERGFYEIQRDTIKRFTSCGLSHAITQAALDLAREHDLHDSDLEEVGIYIHGGPDGENLVGGPFEMGENPQVSAQFCAAYSVAVALLRRKAGLAEFTNERILEDTEVADLARRIRILDRIDNPPQEVRIEDDFPPHVDKPHVLIVKTKDGRELRKTYTIRAILSPNAVTMDDAIGKFRQCMEFSGARLRAGIEDIIATIETLEQLDRATDLINKCTREAYHVKRAT
jgi:2-methylcitrate dehydratase PrpD